MKEKPKYYPYLDIVLFTVIIVFILATLLAPFFLARD
jgi:hypothetical protein